MGRKKKVWKDMDKAVDSLVKFHLPPENEDEVHEPKKPPKKRKRTRD